VTTLKTAWRNLREKAGVQGRWHDSRHTLITDLAESGASNQTIMDIAGHVSKQILKHYSHIRMEAKRAALESILQKDAPVPTATQQVQMAYPQNSPRSGEIQGSKCSKNEAKRLNVRPETWVTERTGDMGYTFSPVRRRRVGCHGRNGLLWTNAYAL
jgi:hypothetical protein